jgi:hypothetical protein
VLSKHCDREHITHCDETAVYLSHQASKRILIFCKDFMRHVHVPNLLLFHGLVAGFKVRCFDLWQTFAFQERHGDEGIKVESLKILCEQCCYDAVLMSLSEEKWIVTIQSFYRSLSKS